MLKVGDVKLDLPVKDAYCFVQEIAILGAIMVESREDLGI